jgi:hypothetical protein
MTFKIEKTKKKKKTSFPDHYDILIAAAGDYVEIEGHDLKLSNLQNH